VKILNSLARSNLVCEKFLILEALRNEMQTILEQSFDALVGGMILFDGRDEVIVSRFNLGSLRSRGSRGKLHCDFSC
jgi:hypothetical protein